MNEEISLKTPPLLSSPNISTQTLHPHLMNALPNLIIVPVMHLRDHNSSSSPTAHIVIEPVNRIKCISKNRQRHTIGLKIRRQMCRLIFAMELYFKNVSFNINRLWYGWYLLNPMFEKDKCTHFRRQIGAKPRHIISDSLKVMRVMCMVKASMKRYFSLAHTGNQKYWEGWNLLNPMLRQTCDIIRVM